MFVSGVIIMRWRQIIHAALYLLSAMLVANMTAAQSLPPTHLSPPAMPVPLTLFGLHIHRPSPETWPQVPFAEWRLWDTRSIVWPVMEPNKEQFNFAPLDRDVALAEQHHVGLLLTLGQTPPWATVLPDGTHKQGPLGAQPPLNEEDWKTYVRTVATRYKGHIQAYEVWNEPNLKQTYSGTREQLFALAKDAYEVIHEVDPSALVLTPSITGSYDIGWFKHYLDLGGGKYADVIAYHIYTSPKNPESGADTIRQVLAAMHERGINKPLWNTESGYTVKSSFTQFTPEGGSLSRMLTQEEALGYVMRAYLINWASNVSRLYWYDWDGDRMGLGDNSGRQKKPSANGYETVERWMVGAVVRSCDSDADQNWTCVLERGGRTQYIIWNADKATTAPLPKGTNVRQMETLSATGDAVTKALQKDANVTYAPIPALLR